MKKAPFYTYTVKVTQQSSDDLHYIQRFEFELGPSDNHRINVYFMSRNHPFNVTSTALQCSHTRLILTLIYVHGFILLHTFLTNNVMYTAKSQVYLPL